MELDPTHMVIMKNPVYMRRNLRSHLEFINLILRLFSEVWPRIIPTEMKKVSRMVLMVPAVGLLAIWRTIVQTVLKCLIVTAVARMEREMMTRGARRKREEAMVSQTVVTMSLTTDPASDLQISPTLRLMLVIRVKC